MSRRIHLRRYAVVVAAVVLAFATGCSGITEAPPTTESGRGECPLGYDDEAVANPTRTGDLVSTAATQAVLCAYAAKTAMRLNTDRPPAAKDVAAVVTYLNTLPVLERKPKACTGTAQDAYLVLLTYPSGHQTVRVDASCATASASGALRQLDPIEDLLAFWPNLIPA